MVWWALNKSAKGYSPNSDFNGMVGVAVPPSLRFQQSVPSVTKKKKSYPRYPVEFVSLAVDSSAIQCPRNWVRATALSVYRKKRHAAILSRKFVLFAPSHIKTHVPSLFIAQDARWT